MAQALRLEEERTVGLVETRSFSLPGPLPLDGGEVLEEPVLAYETYGRLNKKRDNAILICHALTGDAHAAGYHSPRDRKPGWWETLIGPGKGIDTDRFFVICSNVIGGCKGSTGPSSPNPRTGRPYGLDFPIISVGDMVRAQAQLVDYLGIETLHGVVGGSMGGMQVLQWAVSYPERLQKAVVIASALAHNAQQIAFNEVGRQAIMADPGWRQGHYYGTSGPRSGLAVARMVGHITYLCREGMDKKFGRRIQYKGGEKFSPSFAVESYLSYQGKSFVERFDANSYLYITKAIDNFNLAPDGRLEEVLVRVQAETLVVSFDSDWLYPSYQSQEIAAALEGAGCRVDYWELASDYGHDAFLIENPPLSALVRDFLS